MAETTRSGGKHYVYFENMKMLRLWLMERNKETSNLFLIKHNLEEVELFTDKPISEYLAENGEAFMVLQSIGGARTHWGLSLIDWWEETIKTKLN